MPATILVIEDHDILRQSLRGWLEVFFPGCRIIEAVQEAEAITLAQANFPQVIIIDIDLSAINGFDAVKRIKAAIPTAPVVVLADHEDEAHRTHAAINGASAYVCKRAMLTNLEPTLETLLPAHNEPVGLNPTRNQVNHHGRNDGRSKP